MHLLFIIASFLAHTDMDRLRIRDDAVLFGRRRLGHNCRAHPCTASKATTEALTQWPTSRYRVRVTIASTSYGSSMQCHHVNLPTFGVTIVGVKPIKVLSICEDSTCFTIQCIQYVDIEIPLSCIILLHLF